jgi:hypothetical protein
MNNFVSSRAVKAALIGVAVIGFATVSRAEVKDYEFQLVDPSVQVGSDRTIAVKLVNKNTGKPVADAVIFAMRLDMAPDGMQEMATKITPMAGGEPGIYRFKANVSMAGHWQLSLGAKVQGETGTVESRLTIQASK